MIEVTNLQGNYVENTVHCGSSKTKYYGTYILVILGKIFLSLLLLNLLFLKKKEMIIQVSYSPLSDMARNLYFQLDKLVK